MSAHRDSIALAQYLHLAWDESYGMAGERTRVDSDYGQILHVVAPWLEC